MARQLSNSEFKNLQIIIKKTKNNEEFVFSLKDSKMSFLENAGKTIPDITSKSQKHKSSIYNIFDEGKAIIPRVKTFKSIIKALNIGSLQAVGLVCMIVVKAVFAKNDDNKD